MLTGLLVLRIVLMFVVPQIDSTESRYAEISRKIVETGNWLTPQHDYAVPFWAKPPLSMWTSAAGMQVFGVSDFSARIGILLVSLVLLWLIYRWCKQARGREFAAVAVTILFTTVIFFTSAAFVQTDLLMVLGTSAAMVAFWNAMHNDRRQLVWGYLFFVGLAIGLLAKGPVAIVLSAIPIGGWVLFRNEWIRTWKNIPWISGTLLMLLIAAPWYYLAEKATPGYLEYFFVGEHYMRYTVSGWEGDMYGNAHSKPIGTIWLLWLAMLLPWSFLPLMAIIFRRNSTKDHLRRVNNAKSGWMSYVTWWALAPVLFFTVSRNVIPSYVLPGVPAAAVWILEVWLAGYGRDSRMTLPMQKVMSAIVLSFAGIWVVACIIFAFYPQVISKNSQKQLVLDAQEMGLPLYYYGKRQYSAEFYSDGEVVRITDKDPYAEHLQLENAVKKPKFMLKSDIGQLLENDQQDLFAIRKSEVVLFSEDFWSHFEQVKEYKKYLLFREIK
ncbi:ArnT family glycosyltransferase [Persicirhabdus sediminis]|uniref:Glycosyltransferase family 39 protein n=1 Tax=Persicirhabdus sediminis TaxID=454144 RepID=A0A8J7MEQ0_9BACT|nr:glycosyltransferase family 39 protein [Persicirhabdus sediminis]MBK1790474.1 glycosyltransferase family 39 protein [Persicirhabdus sediminis]